MCTECSLYPQQQQQQQVSRASFCAESLHCPPLHQHQPHIPSRAGMKLYVAALCWSSSVVPAVLMRQNGVLMPEIGDTLEAF